MPGLKQATTIIGTLSILSSASLSPLGGRPGSLGQGLPRTIRQASQSRARGPKPSSSRRLQRLSRISFFTTFLAPWTSAKMSRRVNQNLRVAMRARVSSKTRRKGSTKERRTRRARPKAKDRRKYTHQGLTRKHPSTATAFLKLTRISWTNTAWPPVPSGRSGVICERTSRISGRTSHIMTLTAQ